VKTIEFNLENMLSIREFYEFHRVLNSYNKTMFTPIMSVLLATYTKHDNFIISEDKGLIKKKPMGWSLLR